MAAAAMAMKVSLIGDSRPPRQKTPPSLTAGALLDGFVAIT